jgi:L-cysteine/cystine lyase
LILAAITEAFVTIQQLGPFTEAVWPTINRTVAALRKRLAAWFGVEAHRVAFTKTCRRAVYFPSGD